MGWLSGLRPSSSFPLGSVRQVTATRAKIAQIRFKDTPTGAPEHVHDAKVPSLALVVRPFED
jgi:hypothetical protein